MQLTSGPSGDGVVDRLRLAFDTSALSLTVGAEEELMLVDPRSGALVAGADAVLDRLPKTGGFQREFRAAQLETTTRPCLSAADVYPVTIASASRDDRHAWKSDRNRT